jgi:hypothetical protein
MKFLILMTVACSAYAQSPQTIMTAERAQSLFTEHAARIEDAQIRRTAVQNNGRIKPFDSLAREAVLFLTGSYGRWGLTPAQIYLALIVDEAGPFVPLIEVRSPDLREELGAVKSQRFFSMAELENSPLQGIVEPLLQKNQENPKSLSEKEKKVLEVFQQFQLARFIQTGEHFIQSVDLYFY